MQVKLIRKGYNHNKGFSSWNENLISKVRVALIDNQDLILEFQEVKNNYMGKSLNDSHIRILCKNMVNSLAKKEDLLNSNSMIEIQ